MAARFDNLAPGTTVTACPIISLKNSRDILGQGESGSFDDFIEMVNPVGIGDMGVDLVSVLGGGDLYCDGVKYCRGFFVIIGQKADRILVDDYAAGGGIEIGVSFSSSSVSTIAAFPFPLSCLGSTFSFVSSSSYNMSAYLLIASAPSLCCLIIHAARSCCCYAFVTKSSVARLCMNSCFSRITCRYSSMCFVKFLNSVTTCSVALKASLATATMVSAWVVSLSLFT